MDSIDRVSDDSVFTRSEHVVSRTVDGEEVIVEPGNGMVNIISAVGSRIWGLLDGNRTAVEIANIIAAEYEVEPDQALRDCLGFLSDMESKKLVNAAE